MATQAQYSRNASTTKGAKTLPLIHESQPEGSGSSRDGTQVFSHEEITSLANGERRASKDLLSPFNFNDFIKEYLKDIENDKDNEEETDVDAKDKSSPKRVVKPRAATSSRERRRQCDATQQSLPECPVCRQQLDGKVKRVFSAPLATDVQFPFIDAETDASLGQGVRVKFCYPCYQHVISQWREYRRLGMPARQRIYTDRAGRPLAATAGQQRRITNETQAAWRDDRTNKVHATDTKYQDEMRFLREQIQLNDVKIQQATQKLGKEIEVSTKKYLDELTDEIRGMKLESDAVRRQVLRMRKELADTRAQFKKDIKSLKKMIRDYSSCRDESNNNYEKT